MKARCFSIILFMLMLAPGMAFLFFTAMAIGIHQDISKPEGIVPWAALEFANGRPIYDDWRQWPHRFMPYGPMLTAPIGLISRAMGITNFEFSIYFLGRLQSVLYLVGCLMLAAHILARAGWNRWWAFAAFAAYASLWTGTLVPIASYRADYPALFWAMLAAAIGFGAYSPRRAALATACFFISLTYKPAYWSFPAAYALCLLAQRRWQSAALWCGSLGVCVVAYMMLGNLLTDGRFLLNQIGASSMGLTLDNHKLLWTTLTGPQDLPIFTWGFIFRLGLALAAAVYLLRTSFQGWAIYLYIATALNAIMLFKAGAGPNYLMESWYLAGIVLGITLVRFRETLLALPYRRYLTAAAIAGLLFIPAILGFKRNLLGGFDAIYYWPPPLYHKQFNDFPATAFLGDESFIYPAPAPHALCDPMPYVFLMNQGKISPEPFLQRIREQQFTQMVLTPAFIYLFNAPDRAPAIGEAIRDHYSLARKTDKYELWLPK